MKAISIIAILVIAIFLAGCALQEIGVMSEEEYEKQASEETAAPKKTISSQPVPAEPEAEPEEQVEEEQAEEEEEEYISIEESTTGEKVTLKKLGDPWREKDVTEKCDLDFPFECSKYLAKDGIIYITIKNQGYSSKVDDVTLYLKGDTCDPADTYIETGQNKDFECFENPDVDVVSGNLEIDYYVPVDKTHRIKTGSIVVIME